MEKAQLKEAILRLQDWYAKDHRPLPWRQTKDPYAIWISEIMLQQTRCEAVVGYYHRFLDKLPDVKALAEAEEETVLKLWEGLGYYSRARNLQKAAKTVMARHGGSLPDNYKTLLTLSGIGPYTAAAIASIAFDEKIAAVDGNLLRVAARLTGDETPIDLPKHKETLTALLTDVYPQKGSGDCNQALMELGATVCLPVGKPKCDICPLEGLCVAKKEASWQRLPVRLPKRERKTEEKTVFCILCGDKLVLQKPREKGLLARLFLLPMTEGNLSPHKAKEVFPFLADSDLQPLPNARHIFTHITWEMQGYLAILPADTPLPDHLEAFSLQQLQEGCPVPSAHSSYLSVGLDLLAKGA